MELTVGRMARSASAAVRWSFASNPAAMDPMRLRPGPTAVVPEATPFKCHTPHPSETADERGRGASDDLHLANFPTPSSRDASR